MYCLAIGFYVFGATTVWYYPIITLLVFSIVCVLGVKNTYWLLDFFPVWDRNSNRAPKYLERSLKEFSDKDLSDSPRLEMQVKEPVNKKSRPYLYKNGHRMSFSDVATREIPNDNSILFPQHSNSFKSNKGDFLAATNATDFSFQIPQKKTSQTSHSDKHNPSSLPKITTATTIITEVNESKEEFWKDPLKPMETFPTVIRNNGNGDYDNDTNLHHILAVDESIFDDNQYDTLINSLERDVRQLSARQKSPMQKFNRPLSFPQEDDMVLVSMEGSAIVAAIDNDLPVVVTPGRRRPEGLPGSPLGPGTRAQLLMALSATQSEKHGDKKNSPSFNSSRSDKKSSNDIDSKGVINALSGGRQRGRTKKHKTLRGPGSQLYISPSIG